MSYQIVSNTDTEQGNGSFFTERLSYYLQGAQQCVSVMKQFNRAAGTHLLELAKQLVAEIETLADEPEKIEIETETDLFAKPQAKEEEKEDEPKLPNLEEELEEEQEKAGEFDILGLEEFEKSLESDPQTPATELNLEVEEVGDTETELVNAPSKYQDKAVQATKEETEGIQILTPNQPAPPKPKNQLESKVDQLHQAYLNSTKKTLKEAKLLASNIYTFDKVPHIGGNHSLVAVKDHTSYLMVTNMRGLYLSKSRIKIYSQKFEKFIKDLIYIEDYDAYFLCVGNKIYRKDNDRKPPYLFMNFSCGYRVAACFRYSKVNRRLIANLDGKFITVINLDTKEVEIMIDDPDPENLYDFQILGEKEDQVLSATVENNIILYRLDYINKKGNLAHKVKLPVV